MKKKAIYKIKNSSSFKNVMIPITAQIKLVGGYASYGESGNQIVQGS